MKTTRWLLVAAALALGCTDGRSPITPAKFDAAVPDAAPDAARPLDAALKPDVDPALPAGGYIDPTKPRPEGEPTSRGDLAALSNAAEAGKPVDKPGAPPIKRLDAYRVQVGAVFVDRLRRFIRVPARVNMEEGILEYYGVGTNGKLHESVLEVLAEPSHMHLGLLLVGLEPRTWHKLDDMYAPPAVEREGHRLELKIAWTDPKTGEKRTDDAEVWLFDRRTGKAPPKQNWFFQGSMFWNGRYTADLERSMIGLIPDQTSVVAIGESAGNPYQGQSQGFEVYKGVIPPKGTRVELTIAAYGVGEPTKGPDGRMIPGSLPDRPPPLPKPPPPKRQIQLPPQAPPPAGATPLPANPPPVDPSVQKKAP